MHKMVYGGYALNELLVYQWQIWK